MKLLKATSLVLALGAIDQASAAYADADKISGVTSTIFDVFNTEAECKAGTPVKKEAIMVTGTGCMPQDTVAAPDGPAEISILTATAYERQKYTDKACTTKDTAQGNKETWLFTCEAFGPSEWRKKSTKTAYPLYYENYSNNDCTTLTSRGYFSLKDGCNKDPSDATKFEKITLPGGKIVGSKYTSADCSGTPTKVNEYPLRASCMPNPGAAGSWFKNYQFKDGSSFSAGAPAPMLAAAAAATCLFVHAVALFI